MIRASRKSDVILVLGVSGCAFLPVFRLFSKKRLIINIDGLEHHRDKWNKWVRRFLKFSEKQAVKYGDVIVTDNKGITDYVLESGRSSMFRSKRRAFLARVCWRRLGLNRLVTSLRYGILE